METMFSVFGVAFQLPFNPLHAVVFVLVLCACFIAHVVACKMFLIKVPDEMFRLHLHILIIVMALVLFAIIAAFAVADTRDTFLAFGGIAMHLLLWETLIAMVAVAVNLLIACLFIIVFFMFVHRDDEDEDYEYEEG